MNGGLDIAVQSVLGGDLAWYSEIEPAACKVLEAHHPDVPNLGDITAIDWQYVKHDHGRVDVITAGYPCQPFSTAGLRKGTDDERHLWPYVRHAIRVLRPSLVVLENVRDHLALGFDVVLADLAELGLSARWGVVRASDAGAPHQRARLFVAAYPTRGPGRAWQGWGLPEPAGAAGFAAHGMAPTADALGERHHGGREQGAAATQGGGRTDAPRLTDVAWSQYEPAIRRWESIMGRPAPAPVIDGPRRMTLNPEFCEWMMGLPAGWVTGHGLKPSQELKLCGNGVIPRQARLALTLLGVAS